MDPRLLQLTITGLNAEAQPVGCIDPLRRLGLQAPIGIDQSLTSLAASSPAPVTAMDADLHGGRLAIGIGQRIARPAVVFVCGKPIGTARPPRIRGFTAAADDRHEERITRCLEIADDFNAVEAPVKQQQTRTYARAARRAQQLLEHTDHSRAPFNPHQCDRKALAFMHYVTGGIGMKVGGAALGLTAIDLLEALMGLAVVGDQRHVDRQAASASAQRFGQLRREATVELLLQHPWLGTECDQGIAYGLIAGRLAQPAAGGKH